LEELRSMAKNDPQIIDKVASDILQMSDNSIQNLNRNEKLTLLIKVFTDDANEGLILLDENGCVLYTNKKHAEYLKIPQEKALNAHIAEIAGPEVANGFLNVMKTGEPVLRKIFNFHGKEYVANQVPLIWGGKVIGMAGVILFDIREVDEINKRLVLLENRVRHYKEQLKILRSHQYSFEDIIGKSDPIITAKKAALLSSKINSNILLIGESGTGKELFAHAIHNASPRKSKPFIRVNCSAIPQELLESELFGYEPGAFTGALKSVKKGKFELANGGTIFLDEIGDMPLQMQSELLRVLQEKEVDRIGGTKSIKVDFRLIAATNKNLEKMVQNGLFRLDLFYRINVVRIDLPPLRKITEDLPILAEFLLLKKSKEMGLDKIALSPKDLKKLQCYSYPGNVRELGNILERALGRIDTASFSNQKLTLMEGDITSVLRFEENREKEYKGRTLDLKDMKHDQEFQAIKEAIRLSAGNLTKCAKILGIHRTSVYKKIRLFNLYPDILLARKTI